MKHLHVGNLSAFLSASKPELLSIQQKRTPFQAAGNPTSTLQKQTEPLLELEIMHEKELFLLQTAVKRYGRTRAGKKQWSDITNSAIETPLDVDKGDNADIILLLNLYQRIHWLRNNKSKRRRFNPVKQQP